MLLISLKNGKFLLLNFITFNSFFLLVLFYKFKIKICLFKSKNLMKEIILLKKKY